ncbi:ALS2 C-terminal-like protein [Rhineura floridana]|uniref:ALS2 C-terminal-like protein n=1 Tax=Rhineura floridana TaxID=261503 RepID=UPI002AC83E46|nr:ALS2 C-terminal-like protein [Rhineura floridana]XP_061443338.1 ALS2 C-terminal-like protein [Rhineura floridana]XP_061443339.1 ALS2 C-terminal-like protein [Rhineura floridana]XP_061443340.1 ALS2 C-terminal-like protein [Rhineura floridana]XP_061443341.1 ALS2 C-terminal-like protein [Rhineura floridana]XP_061443342.1 ALS2 C-terminal-like protein [Rhineura floridana]XP_061443343.1 ALS2 C-terminal-like protein [Rhineura floridana]XP_061443344.1 ALS2 C-terminal-like protein [Rhineura florid
MSISEVAASLLRTEETFSACLSRISSVLLTPLLQSGSFENVKLLVHLNDHFHIVWDLTAENYRTLKQTFSTPESDSIQDLFLVRKTDLFLDAYVQYFSTFASCVSVQVFDHAAKNKSHLWKAHKSSLQQFLADFSPDTSLAMALHTVLHKPFRDHLQQYSLVFSKLNETLHQYPDKESVTGAAKEFAKLQSFICQVLDEASHTRSLWKSLCHKFTDVLCVPERRLLEDSRNLVIFANTGRSDRVLLFSDILVLIQGNNFQSFDLKLTWVDGACRETGEHTLRICTPEEVFFLLAKEPESRAVWQWKLNQTVRQALIGKRDFPLWGEAGEGRDPPVCRFSAFTFRGEGRFKSATYEGEWRLGQPHGKGTLTWPDGRNYVGDFKEGLEHGFGICLVPRASRDRYDCYKCHWREGQMNGYGICEYGDEMVYKGYFKDNVRQGFGVLDNPSDAEHPFKYTGHWENDKKHSYGIWDDKERGERYIGMWHEDQRHGPGIVVMQSGICYQRTFHMDKMVGSGTLLLEDDSIFVGNFTRDLTFVGKGKLTFSNGFTLEGTFSSKSSHGLQTQGVLDTSGEQQDNTITKLQLGKEVFPVERRWEGLYSQFQEFICTGGQGETEEAFMGFHVQTSKELRKSQEYLFCDRGAEETAGKVDYLEELIEHQEKGALQSYLQQALESSLHPLGKFLKALSVAFQATYSGIGANRHLLSMAQEEIKHYAKKMWEFYQGLLHLALEVQGQPPAEGMEQSDLNGPGLMLPLILPCFYPELLLLYMLYHQKEDDLYCQGIVDLSLFPDVKLLEFLDVQKHLWPLKDLTLTNNQRQSLVKDHCFLSATECLQKLITTVDPREKLDILQKTYEEIEKTVNRVLEKDYSLPMDDLLPLLMYVVTRASIQHLGAEIHLIRDLMDPTNEGGMYDFLLTALESCYELIQKDIRVHQSWQVLQNS